MKKIFILMSAMVLALALNAQQVAQKYTPTLTRQAVTHAVYTAAPSAEGYTFDAVPFRAPAKEVDTTLFASYFADGQMYRSVEPGYISDPTIFIPYSDTVYFYSVYGTGNWEYYNTDVDASGRLVPGTKETVKDTAILTYPLDQLYGGYFNPTLSIPGKIQIPSKDETILYNISFKDYMYGYGAEAFWPKQGVTPTNFLAGYYYAEDLTNCEMMTGDDTDKSSAQNRYYVSSHYGGYCFGPGLSVPEWGKGTADTLTNVLPLTEGTSFWLDTIKLNVYSESANAIPEGDTLTIKIYPIDIVVNPLTGEVSQKFRHDTVLAQATATHKDIVIGDSEYPEYQSITFVLTEQSWHGTAIKPAVLTQRCFAELTGINDGDCDFAIFSDYYDAPTGGRTLWLKGGKLYTYGDMNIDMVFHGFFPDMRMIEDTWLVEEMDEEGGAIQMGFKDKSGQTQYDEIITMYCNMVETFDDYVALYDEDGEEIDPSTDKIVADFEAMYDEDDYLLCYAYIEINPNEGYDREFTLYLSSCGASLPIHIKQTGELGPDPGTGLFNVKAVNDNKTYNVFGMEVNKNFKGVVIRNGIKSIQ